MANSLTPRDLAQLPDDALLEAVQRQTFAYFWDGAHPLSGMAPDRSKTKGPPLNDLVSIGGSGFGIMSIIVAAERAWISRDAAVERILAMLDLLNHATCYHGAFPHFMNGRTGATIPFTRKDDAGDLVETSLLVMGLYCAREYLDRDTPAEAKLRSLVDYICNDIEWDWYARGRNVLSWHWSPNNGWAIDLDIRGWNESLITYVLAAGSKRYGIDPDAYHRGFADGRNFSNGKAYYGIDLPLGLPFGGPLYFAHYSFCGLDPRGLKDRYADYWQQNLHHVRINHAHCEINPQKFPGYSNACWGLTSSDGADGYSAHSPEQDDGTIAPTAAASSMPYAPRESTAAIRHFLSAYGERAWGRYGFVDAFNVGRNWFADTFLAIDQGPIILMIENYRSGLLWKLCMQAPEIQTGLSALNFSSPHLSSPPT